MTIRAARLSSAKSRLKTTADRSMTAALLTGTALGCTLLIGAAPALADDECGPAGATVICAAGTYSNGIRYANLTEALALNIPVGAVITTTADDTAGIVIDGGLFDTSLTQRGVVSTSGDASPGIYVTSDTGRITIDAESVITRGGLSFDSGNLSEGISAYSNSGAISVTAQDITVGGLYTSALFVQTGGTADVLLNSGQINSTSTDSVTLGVLGGRNITINSDAIQTNNQAISVGNVRNTLATAGLVTINTDTVNIGGVASGSAISVNTASKDVVIDSGTITTGGTASAGIGVTGANVTITSGSLNTSGSGIVVTGGAIDIAATGDTASTGAGALSAIRATGTGDVTIENAGTASSAGTNATLWAVSTGGTASVTSNIVRNTGTGPAILATGTNGATIDSVTASATSGTNGIQAQSTTAGNTVVNSGTLTGSAASNSIFAVSNNGSATITAGTTVNANTAANAWGLYANGLTGATVTAGSVDAQGPAIRAQSSTGNASVTTTGDITSRGSNTISISAASFDVTTAAGTTITSNGGSAAIAGGASTGNGSVINNGTVAARGIAETGIGITTTGDATVVSNIVTVEGTAAPSGRFPSAGISAVSNGGGDVSVTSNSVTVQGFNRYGIIATAIDAGTVTVNSGTVSNDAAYTDAISAAAWHGAVSVTSQNATSTGDVSSAVAASSRSGDVAITVGTASASGDGAAGVAASTDYGNITINATDVTTSGDSLVDLGEFGAYAEAVRAFSVYGDISITSGKTTVSGFAASGVSAESLFGNITVRSAEVASTAANAAAIGLYTSQSGDISLTSGIVNAVTAGLQVSSAGDIAISSATVNTGDTGIYAVVTGAGDIGIDSGAVSTTAAGARGIRAVGNAGAVTIVSDSVATQGNGAIGIQAQSGGAVSVTSTTASTAGVADTVTNADTGVTSLRNANAIRAISRDDAVSVTSGTATTSGAGVGAIYASAQTDLTLNLGTVTASGAETEAEGVIAVYGQALSGSVNADITGPVSATNGIGASLNALGVGAVNATIAAGASVTGLHGGLALSSTSGVQTVTNYGRIEATEAVLSGRSQAALDLGGDDSTVGQVVNNYGTIASGLNDPSVRGSAISYSDGGTDDTLNLYTGSNIVGSVEMFGGTDTVNLNGTRATKTTTQVLGSIYGSEALNVATGYWTMIGEVEASSVDIVSGATLDIGFVPTGALNGAITANGTLAFSMSDALTYDGVISGTGSLLKLGNSALTLAGANTFTGTTTVAGGTLILATNLTSNTVVNSGATLQIGTGGETGSLIGDLVANGTVIFDRSGDYLLAGALSGNGTLVKQGAGLLTLDGVYTFTGTTSILGGTLKISQLAAGSELEVGNGATVDLSGGEQTVSSLSGGSGSAVNIEDATLTVSQTGQGTTNTFGGSLTGSGSLIVEGTGNFVLSGNNTYTGPTTINAGLLTINGSINSPTTVADGGTLGGSGQINGLVNITDGGTLAPGNSPGTLNIAGPLTLASGSTLAIEVDPTLAPNHDQVNVTGTATIVAGAKLEVRPLGAIGNYDRTQSYTILTANGGVTGRFAAADISTTMALLTPTLSYTSNAVTLRLLRNDITFQSLALGSNQRAVATAAEAVGMGASAYEALVTQSAGGAQAGYDSLSGEAFGSTASLLLNQSRHQREALLGRAAMAEERGAWFQVLNGATRISATPISARARDEETGIAGGADAVAGAWTLGLSMSYRQSDIEVASRNSQSEVETFSGGLYAGTTVAGLRLGGGFDYARHEVDSTRGIAFPGVSQTVEGNYDAETQQVFVEASYPMTLAGAAFEPFGSVAGVTFTSDDVSETGGTLGLNVEGQDRSVILTDLGARISLKGNAAGAAIYPRVSMAWRHASGDIEGTSSAAFGTTGFTVRGGDLAEDSAVIDAGVGMDLGRNGTAWLSYNGVYADKGSSNAVMLGASFSF